MKNIFLSAIITCFIQYAAIAQCWQKIAVGGNHNLALKTDNTLWTWGSNNVGQLGNGNNINSNIPIKIGNATNWSQIAAGVSGDHSLAIKTDGTLWAWGYNFYGQLGDGTSANRNAPIQIGVDADWSYISAGLHYSLALKTNGTIWAWGRNNSGQLGIGSNLAPNDIKLIPTQVGTATDWVKIIAGDAHSLAIKANGTLWAWGFNLYGQLGNGLNTDRLIPTQIGTATNWSQIAGGDGHTVALKTDSTLWTWGDNQYLQLGNGTSGPGTNTNLPASVGIATDWAKITSGEFHAFAIKTDGTLWSWGRNEWSQLGIGNNINQNILVQTGTATNWAQMGGGRQHSVALKSDGTLWAFGRNTLGQLGDGTNVTQTTPVQIICSNPIPVTWLYLQGQLQNNKALIKWATASEINTLTFEVEHSNNGISYSTIASVPAAGNSNSVQHYQFIHPSPIAGKNYYRVKQIDIDGRYSYSSIISVNKTNQRIRFQIVPNPVTDNFTILTDYDKAIKYQIFTTTGQQKKSGIAMPNNRMDISALATGIYLLKCEGQVLKFIKK